MANCDYDVLLDLQAMLENGNLELIDKSEGMMTIEHAYANFIGNEYAAGCPDKAKGIWIQFKRDATKRKQSNKFQVRKVSVYDTTVACFTDTTAESLNDS